MGLRQPDRAGGPVKRLWWSGPGAIVALTDEEALERLVRRPGSITPLMGENELKAELIATNYPQRGMTNHDLP